MDAARHRWQPSGDPRDRPRRCGGARAGSGGKVYVRQSAGQWRRFETPVTPKFNGVARTDTYDVAMGAGGTIVERSVDRDAEAPSDNKSVGRYVKGAVETA